MDHLAERDIVNVAVDEARPRRVPQRLAIETLDRFVIPGPTITQIEIRSEAAHVRHQLFDGDRVPAFAFHLGDELNNGITQSDPALFDEDHDAGGGGYDLGQTREIENRICRHRFAQWLDGARAVRLAPDDFSMTTDEHDGAGQLLFRDGFGNDRVHARQTFGRKSL